VRIPFKHCPDISPMVSYAPKMWEKSSYQCIVPLIEKRANRGSNIRNVFITVARKSGGGGISSFSLSKRLFTDAKKDSKKERIPGKNAGGGGRVSMLLKSRYPLRKTDSFHSINKAF